MSHLWRSILHTRPLLDKGVKWTMGDGSKVDLWKDWWCSNDPLAKRYPGSHVNDGSKVSQIIGTHNTWDLVCLYCLSSNLKWYLQYPLEHVWSIFGLSSLGKFL